MFSVTTATRSSEEDWTDKIKSDTAELLEKKKKKAHLTEETWSSNTWQSLRLPAGYGPAPAGVASVAEFDLLNVRDQSPGQVDPHHLITGKQVQTHQTGSSELWKP